LSSGNSASNGTAARRFDSAVFHPERVASKNLERCEPASVTKYGDLLYGCRLPRRCWWRQITATLGARHHADHTLVCLRLALGAPPTSAGRTASTPTSFVTAS
jgi:hypothetical protein